MKKLVIIGIIVAAFASACNRDNPHAQFSVNYSLVQPGEVIQFTNMSTDAVSYHWDFGDGYTSTSEHPTHYYDSEDDFVVTLTITSPGGNRDVISLTISCWYTVLGVTVAEWNPDEVVEYIVDEALVILYDSYEDWYHDDDPIAYGYTDGAGEIWFPYDADEQYYLLEPINYWVYTEKLYADETFMYHNLFFDEDGWLDYLQTGTLYAFDVNEFLAWADLNPEKSASSRLEKYPKLENKTNKAALLERRTE
ncbi:MAG: PKD domain-containing protein [Bacteroidales bacterium]|nr:PKD domain-containing protein [Bacteroidales bacterium]